MNLLPTLVAFLASQPEGFDPRTIGADGNTVPVRMEQDGRFINFPADRLRRILTTLAELYDPESLRDGVLPIHALRAADLASRPFGDELFSTGRLKFQKLASRLANAGGIRAASEPVGFQGVLRTCTRKTVTRGSNSFPKTGWREFWPMTWDWAKPSRCFATLRRKR